MDPGQFLGEVAGWILGGSLDRFPCGSWAGSQVVPSHVPRPFPWQFVGIYKIFEGMPVTFTCKVAGNPKPKVRKDGKCF